MDYEQVQKSLLHSYVEWKAGLQFSPEEAASLSPPLLLSVTEDYCKAEKRIIVFGQETYGWGWNETLQKKYPDYPENWSFSAIENMADFLNDRNGVEHLCWGYKAFEFSRYQKGNRNSPFWRAFREVQHWPGAGVMWSNLSRCDYTRPEGTNGNSIFQAPEDLREKLAIDQKDLLLRELEILKPHTCVFFTGPYYDSLLTASLPNCTFSSCSPQIARRLAQLSDASLPPASFRTYHPNYLSREKAGKWEFIESIKSKVYSQMLVKLE